jgi:recombination protein RecA
MGRHKKNKKQPSVIAKPEVIDDCNQSKIDLVEHNIEIKPTISKEQKEKKERLIKLMNEINREQKGIVLKFAKDEPDKEKLPFGIKPIDELTGNGGIAGNYIIIWGSESVGKSTLALCQVAQAQREGKLCAYIDLEHAFNKDRAKQFGVNIDELLLIENASYAEEAMDFVIKLANEKAVDLIIIDSIQAMTPKAENEGKSGKERLMEEDEIAMLAKKMGKFLRRTATPIYKAKIGVTLIGQSRTGGIGTFATHEELTGGRSQKHWSLLTVFLRKGQGADAPTEKIETGELDEKGKPIKINKKVGFDCVLSIQKTKTNSKPEGHELHIPFKFKEGFVA